ncbi:MAG: sulfite exporter TauE/SafE family protein, partial [Acinetobacter johnsonii]
MELIIYLLIGAIAGFAAGLFGVGGGLIIIPILYVVFTHLNYDPSVIMHMAVGTSLATIIVTSMSSVSAHHKRGAVLWSVFRNLAPGLVMGAFLGAGIADYMSGHGLQLLIGFFAVWVAYKMFSGAHVEVDPSCQLPSTGKQLFDGAGIGVASAIFGIGAIVGPVLTGALLTFELPHQMNFLVIAIPGVIAALAVFMVNLK